MTKTTVILLATALTQVSAFAVDGVVLINQSTLNTAGGTYTITQPGSYKLSGNLQAKDQNTNVIVIASNNVTVDLAGFSILGTTDCSGGIPCKNSGLGSGITTLPFSPQLFSNITIRNGTIQGMGNDGIFLVVNSALVEYMHVQSNSGYGIEAASFSGADAHAIVQHNIVHHNQFGIAVDVGLVLDNIVFSNQNGAAVGNGLAARNVIDSNSDIGLSMAVSAGYNGNVIFGNTSNLIGGGLNQGQNVCGKAACPGAVF